MGRKESNQTNKANKRNVIIHVITFPVNLSILLQGVILFIDPMSYDIVTSVVLYMLPLMNSFYMSHYYYNTLDSFNFCLASVEFCHLLPFENS